MKILMTATALTALVAASSAFGQAQDPAQDPLLDSPPAASQPTPDAAPDATSPDAMSPDTGSGAEGQAATPSDMFIEQQDASDVLASSLMGSTVENASEENLGTINDIVLSDEGSIDAVVVGVGGFLGIGQKNIAVPFDQIEKTTDGDGNDTLVLNATREELDAAPSFVTIESQQQEMEQPPASPGAGSTAPPPQ